MPHGWTFDNAPPRGVETWCLVEGGGEPYLVRGVEVSTIWSKDEFRVDATTEENSPTYIPAHHRIIGWRKA